MGQWLVLMKATILLSGMMLLIAQGNAESSTRDAKPAGTDYEVVRTANHFSIGATGYAGTISSTETALRRLLKTPTAAEDCRKLATTGTPAGQLYGLLGLKLLKDSAYQSTAARQRSSRVEVSVTNACVIEKRPTADVARQIDEGKIK